MESRSIVSFVLQPHLCLQQQCQTQCNLMFRLKKSRKSHQMYLIMKISGSEMNV